MPSRTKSGFKKSTAHIGFEAKLWLAAEYNYVVPGHFFLNYILDTFEGQFKKLEAWDSDKFKRPWRVSLPASGSSTRDDLANNLSLCSGEAANTRVAGIMRDSND